MSTTRWTACSFWLISFVIASANESMMPLDDHLMYKGAFSADECAEIIDIFRDKPSEMDTRTIQLLPNMDHDEFRVSRINRFDDGSLMATGRLDFVYSRLIKLQSDMATSPLYALGGLDFLSVTPSNSSHEAAVLEQIRARVGFNLLHEFTVNSASPSAQFDWHADTKPGDGHLRTLNINVMLSAPTVDFVGGELQVGSTRIEAQQGDMYVYAAAVPHRVLPLTSGRRFTLVVAFEELAPTPPADDLSGLLAERRSSYWMYVEASFTRLVSSSLAEAKVHILYGEFLEGSGRGGEARRAYCRAYISLGEEASQAHAQRFLEAGVAALQPNPTANLILAEQYFSMALCIVPELSEAEEALDVVRDAISRAEMRAKQERRQEMHHEDL